MECEALLHKRITAWINSVTELPPRQGKAQLHSIIIICIVNTTKVFKAKFCLFPVWSNEIKNVHYTAKSLWTSDKYPHVWPISPSIYFFDCYYSSSIASSIYTVAVLSFFFSASCVTAKRFTEIEGFCPGTYCF